MSFWGVEIRPSKPFTLHRPTDAHQGKLQISQATLGVAGVLAKRSVVQCNIGNKSPVLLCALLPDKMESCSLNLQFDEEEEVTFSVLGPRSVHLTGFYMGTGKRDHDDDSDSYGEDIANTDNEDDQSADNVEDDDLDDFIVDDDEDIEMMPPPKGRKSALVIEDSDDDEIPANRKGNRKRLKKKYQVSDSDADNEELVAKDHSRRKVPEIEDEDIVPISHMINKKDTTEKIGSSDTGKTSEQLFKPSKDSSVPSSDVGLESDVMPKTKKRKNCVDDGDAKIENMVGVEPEKVQPADMLFKPSKEASLPSTATRLKTTSKKKHRRNCGEDGDAKNIVVDGVEPEKEQPTDSYSTKPSNDIGLQSDVKSKKKIRKNKGENVDVKTENMGQDPVEIKPTQPDDNTTVSVGHVTDQDNGEGKKKKKKKRVQKSAENANDEEEKNR